MHKELQTIRTELKGISTHELKRKAEIFMSEDFRDGTLLVFNCILDELEKRLPEAVFVNYCELLETL